MTVTRPTDEEVVVDTETVVVDGTRSVEAALPMTLEQAIVHAHEVHDSDTSPFCALEHAQLAAWLEELALMRKALRVLCGGLVFVPHPIVGKVHGALLALLHDDADGALAIAEALRAELLHHCKGRHGG